MHSNKVSVLKNYDAITISTEGFKIQIQSKDNRERKYKPETDQVTEFDENQTDNNSWFTQYHWGCIFFSLLSGDYLNKTLKKFFNPNENFSTMLKKLRTKIQTIRGVSHEYKAILVWNILTKNNVIPNYKQYISKKIKEMLKINDLNSAYSIASEINALYEKYEEMFAIKNKKNFAYGESAGWTFNNYKVKVLDSTNDKKLLALKLYYLERLPKYSLFCDTYNHWMVFLGCKNNKMYFYDSYLHDRIRSFDKNYVATKTISILKK